MFRIVSNVNRVVGKRLSLWATCIRESYVMMLPLTVIGAMIVAAGQPSSDAYRAWMVSLIGEDWQLHLNLLFTATIGVTGLMGSIAIADRLSALLTAESKHERAIPFTIGAVSATGFLIAVLSVYAPSFKSLGYISIFQSILVGIATAELMHFFIRWMPQRQQLINVSHGLSLHRALQITGAAILTLTVVGFAALMVANYFRDFAFTIPASWLPYIGYDYILNPLAILTNQLMWLFGVNGGQFLLHVANSQPDLFGASDALYSASGASLMFVNAFAHLGGAGATVGLIICSIWRGKDQDLRNLCFLSLLPAFFNINDLLMLGIPFILSRTLAIPFLLAPLANVFIAMAAIHLGFLQLNGTPVVWSTPLFLSGSIMTDDWSGVIVQALGVAVSVAIYAPFLTRLEENRKRARKAVFTQAVNQIMNSTESVSTHNLEENGFVGEVARCLHADFRAALKSNAVHLFYQPQHDFKGSITGVEALLRWTHPTHGVVPAQAIITLSEESGYIHQVGQWVAERACQDIARWREAGIGGFKVSINMSPMQLEDVNCVNDIRQAMEKYQVTTQELGIELTEGKMLSSSAQAESMLQEMQDLGLSLSMDDFGMGCTSLLYLHRFEIHEIKFDGVLTRNVENQPISQDIIRCVSELACSQKSLVVAEFVETASQQALLRALGCTHFQGWLYSPALSFQDFSKYYLKATAVPAVVARPQEEPAVAMA